MSIMSAGWLAVGLLGLGAAKGAAPKQDLKLELVDGADHPAAKCLDGSSPGFWFQAATNASHARDWQICTVATLTRHDIAVATQSHAHWQ